MRITRLISLLIALLLFATHLVWAAPSVTAPAVVKIRFSQQSEQVRIVLDMNSLPPYKVNLTEDPLRLIVELEGTVNKTGLPQVLLNDPMVAAVRMTQSDKGALQVIIDLKRPVMHKVFILEKPNRIVIDVFQFFEQKVVTEVAQGITYTSWLKSNSDGPRWAHILAIDPRTGYGIKPILSNDMINGVETVSAMAKHSKAIATVNGSYFANNGEIIGLMKVDGQLISSSSIPRTALGIMVDNTFIMDQVAYQGQVDLPKGTKLKIDGINRQRGDNELIVYNGYYNGTTGTNSYGTEIVVKEGKVSAIGTGNGVLFADTTILSAHGKAAQALASLKVGDEVKVTHTVGAEWDKTLHILGAGPMLVKNNSIYLTTKLEGFGSDVAGGRAPRTAVGLTKEGHLLLVVVDGRQVYSAGLTLLEMALFMQDLGAVNAMNLDGGGSSSMVINDKVVNKPSDGKERKVGNALAVTSTRLAN